MILMYHHVSPLDGIPSDPQQFVREGWMFHTLPESLYAQIVYLKKRGYTFLAFSEYVEQVSRHGAAARNAVAITFDDGWRDNPQHALPVLTAAGVSAIFFLVSGVFESVGRESLATEAEIGKLLRGGMEIGAHTRTHRPLAQLPLDQVQAEILGSCHDLESRYGVAIRHLAYPGGSFSRSVAEWVRVDSGLGSAVSTLPAMRNRRESLFWLSRETLREPWDWVARFKLTDPIWRRGQSMRSWARLRAKLR